jgi:hypothetical protein
MLIKATPGAEATLKEKLTETWKGADRASLKLGELWGSWEKTLQVHLLTWQPL